MTQALISLIVIILFVVVSYLVRTLFSTLIVRHTVFEFERALLYRDGKFVQILEPGSYWIWNFNNSINKVGIRPMFVTLPGQELLTADNMSIKISLTVNYKVMDPYSAVQMTDDHSAALYTVSQLELRRLVAPLKIDDLILARPAIADSLQKAIASRVEAFGLEIISAEIRDIMLPADVKKIMTQVVKAQKDAQAALEKTRGETAALRSLANAARMLEANPSLMHLRLLQSIGETSGNTIFYGVPAEGTLTKGHSSRRETEERGT